MFLVQAGFKSINNAIMSYVGFDGTGAIVLCGAITRRQVTRRGAGVEARTDSGGAGGVAGAVRDSACDVHAGCGARTEHELTFGSPPPGPQRRL